jgi:hypothetical protein
MTVTHNPFFKLKLIDLTNDDTVASGGGTNTQTLRPDKGKIYVICSVAYEAPAIALATGEHKLEINITNGTLLDEYGQITGTDGATFLINSKAGFIGSTEAPSGLDEQLDFIRRQQFLVNYDNYITFVYTNNSDTNQTGTRTLWLLVKEYKESV